MRYGRMCGSGNGEAVGCEGTSCVSRSGRHAFVSSTGGRLLVWGAFEASNHAWLYTRLTLESREGSGRTSCRGQGASSQEVIHTDARRLAGPTTDTMLPASLHPLSPMPDEAAPPTPHLPSSSSSLSVPPTPFLNSTEGYFSPRLSTILLPPSTPSPSSSPITPVIPPFLTLKAAPHLLPRDGLDHLPREQLVAIIVALSQANCEAVDEGEKKAREIEALEGMVVQGTGESRRGELERARVRARVDTNGELSVKEWRIELRPEVVEEVEVEVDESEVESNVRTLSSRGSDTATDDSRHRRKLR